MITNTLALAAIYGSASAIRAGGSISIQTTALDREGAASGTRVSLSSSDPSIATVTTAEQLGASPAGVVGQKPGNAVITATALDGSGKVATLNVTVV